MFPACGILILIQSQKSMTWNPNPLLQKIRRTFFRTQIYTQAEEKKGQQPDCQEVSLCVCGPDGTRTRDLRRDRAAF